MKYTQEEKVSFVNKARELIKNGHSAKVAARELKVPDSTLHGFLNPKSKSSSYKKAKTSEPKLIELHTPLVNKNDTIKNIIKELLELL